MYLKLYCFFCPVVFLAKAKVLSEPKTVPFISKFSIKGTKSLQYSTMCKPNDGALAAYDARCNEVEPRQTKTGLGPDQYGAQETHEPRTVPIMGQTGAMVPLLITSTTVVFGACASDRPVAEKYQRCEAARLRFCSCSW